MRVSRYWPGYVLALLAVGGGIAGGLRGALGAPILGMLLVGPGYLLQQHVRRRRGTASSDGLLGRQLHADELVGHLARHWLGYLWLLLALVGGSAGAVSGGISGAAGGAAAGLFLGILVVGPAYLIQQRVRRRRGVPPRGGLLGRDADQVMTALVKPYVAFWVGLAHRHPVGMPVADLLFYVAIITLAWIFVSPTAGIAALVITLALYGLGVVRVLRRRRG